MSPLCPRRKMGFPISLLDCWRPRRDLNPCYRRESTAVIGKLLKSCDTNGYEGELQNRFRTLSEPNSSRKWTIIGPRSSIGSLGYKAMRTLLLDLNEPSTSSPPTFALLHARMAIVYCWILSQSRAVTKRFRAATFR